MQLMFKASQPLGSVVILLMKSNDVWVSQNGDGQDAENMEE